MIINSEEELSNYVYEKFKHTREKHLKVSLLVFNHKLTMDLEQYLADEGFEYGLELPVITDEIWDKLSEPYFRDRD